MGPPSGHRSRLCDRHGRHIEWSSLEPRLLHLLQQSAPLAPATGDLVAANLEDDPDLVVGKLLELEGLGRVTSAPGTRAPGNRRWWWVT